MKTFGYIVTAVILGGYTLTVFNIYPYNLAVFVVGNLLFAARAYLIKDTPSVVLGLGLTVMCGIGIWIAGQ